MNFPNLLPVVSAHDSNAPRISTLLGNRDLPWLSNSPILLLTIIFANIALTDHYQTSVGRKSTQIRKISEARLSANMLPKVSTELEFHSRGGLKGTEGRATKASTVEVSG